MFCEFSLKSTFPLPTVTISQAPRNSVISRFDRRGLGPLLQVARIAVFGRVRPLAIQASRIWSGITTFASSQPFEVAWILPSSSLVRITRVSSVWPSVSKTGRFFSPAAEAELGWDQLA